MNRLADERAPRTRRDVPTGRQFFAFLLSLIAVVTVAAFLVANRLALLAWVMSLPNTVFWCLFALGGLITVASLILAGDYALERIARFLAERQIERDARETTAVADLPPEVRE